MKRNLKDSENYYDRVVPQRILEEKLQGEIRACLRTIVDETHGQWTTAHGLVELLKVRYPTLYQHHSSFITPKSISEYLKTMHLKTKRISTALYLCEKQFHNQ